ncbi:MAG: hypothetical protein Q9168_002035 [Polycauliona sp. 1 TL-2023]
MIFGFSTFSFALVLGSYSEHVYAQVVPNAAQLASLAHLQTIGNAGITWLNGTSDPGHLGGDPSSFGIKLLERSEEMVASHDFLVPLIETVENIYNNHNNGSELVRQYAWPNNEIGLRIGAVQGGLEEGLPITFTNRLMVRYSRWLGQIYKPYKWTKFQCVYGDASDRTRLEEKAANFDPTTYWDNHAQLLPVVAAAARAKLEAASSSPPADKPVYNPYEGQICGRQLNEPVKDFLKRLPPLTTTVSSQHPWIFIANPYATSRPTDRDQAGLSKVAEQLLDAFSQEKNEIETSMAGKAKGSVTRKLTPLRKALETNLLTAAKEKRCTSGKWMLFPYPEDVNRQWAIVAEATANRELGIAAKVAPDDNKGDRVPRLICVYTKDFSDLDDVKRVLGRLVELGLVKKKGGADNRGIYYKADVFTELGINSENEWGLKPSLYASRDLLEAGKK